MQNVLAMILSLAGVALLSSGSLSDGGNFVGILCAVGSAIAYGGYLLWIERTRLSSIDTTVFVALKTVGAVVFLLIFVLFTNQLYFGISFMTFCGLLLSSFVTIMASFCLALAIRHIGSVHTSILGSMEPIVCTVAAFLFLGEAIGLKSGIGIVAVIVATILVTLNKNTKGL